MIPDDRPGSSEGLMHRQDDWDRDRDMGWIKV
jgi:hypothetical protein